MPEIKRTFELVRVISLLKKISSSKIVVCGDEGFATLLSMYSDFMLKFSSCKIGTFRRQDGRIARGVLGRDSASDWINLSYNCEFLTISIDFK